MRLSGEKVRGSSLKPGKRNVDVDPDILMSPVFEAFPGQSENIVRVFDDEGRRTTREVGVKRLAFARLSIFYTLRSLSWGMLITYSIVLYLAILFVCAIMYFGWSTICGASEDTTWTAALYFTVVSLAANGGYMGESQDMMMEPNHVCFVGRTYIVMMLSYTNILFVGMVAALVVSKAEYSGRLGQRVVFSDFCSLSVVPGRTDRSWKLTFRMANIIGERPLTHGRLRLFIVTAEPLKDYKVRRKRLSRMYYEKLLTRGHARHGRNEASERGQGRVSPSYLTRERLQRLLTTKGASGVGLPSQIYPTQDDAPLEMSSREQPQRRSPVKWRDRRRHEKVSTREVDENRGSTAPVEGKGHVQGKTAPAEAMEVPVGESTEKEVKGGVARGTRGVGHSQQEQKQPRTQQTRTASAPSAGAQPYVSLSGEASSSSLPSSDASNASVVTNPSDGSRFAEEAAALHADENGFERVCIRVEEVRWSCSEEKYLDTRGGQLSLWFPVNITHTIDRQSPLYRYIEGDVTESPLTSSPMHSKAKAAKRRESFLRSFQLVATFDATEMESGATITAKRTYTMSDFVTHYRFSDKMVCMKPFSNEVRLDFHYFNEMLPVVAFESSSADSDAAPTT